MENNKICPLHHAKIEYICLFIAKTKKDSKCINRFLCNICNNEVYHDKSHSESTIKIDKFFNEDMSAAFFQLFFSLPQIRTLFKPLKINSELILKKLKEISINLNLSSQSPIPFNTQQQVSQIQGDDTQQMTTFIENAHQKIEILSDRINNIIESIHTYYREQFEWESFYQIIQLFYNQNKITQEQTNSIINNSLQFVHCTQLFIRNVYVVDDNFNLSQLKPSQGGTYTPTDVISFYKFARKELFLNLNHIRALFQICQPQQLQALEKQQRLNLVTNFPLNLKRLLPTISMARINNIKLAKNKLIILRDYECLILHIDTSTLETKLQNTIYSKKIIKDASISLCDDNQITLLYFDNSAGIYSIKPYISVLDNEQISLMEFGNQNDCFIGIDFIKPQRIVDEEVDQNSVEEELEDLTDYIALKTPDQIFFLDSLEWSQFDSFQYNNELFKLEIQSQAQENDEDQMVLENTNKKVICFYSDQQIDYVHFSNTEIFKDYQIKSFAYSKSQKKCVYLTDNELIICSQQPEETIFKPIRNKQAISCMDFTIDNLYLFIIYDNSLIQFYYAHSTFELEYEIHLFKNNQFVRNAYYYPKTNQIFLLSSQGELFFVDLSNPKNFL